MDREYLIGVEVSSSKIEAGLVDLNGKVIKKIIMPTDVKKGKNKVCENIIFAIEKISKDKILGIGIGMPGPVDSKRGIIINPNFPGWKNVPLKKIVEDKLNIRVAVENSANCFTIAEYKCGFGKKISNMVGVLANEAIGGGIMIAGKIYRGVADNAGEIGHMTIVDDGMKCRCGSTGCLEAYSSGYAIIDAYRKASKKTVPIEEIVNLAKKDKRAKKIIEQAAYYFGIGLANIANTLNPEMIVVGGTVASAKGFFEIAEKEMQKRTKVLTRKVILARACTEDSGILGASSTVF